MTPVRVTEGNGPVILSQPHSGVQVPQAVLETLNDTGRQLADADWHLPSLYDGLLPAATVVRAEFHRYVIDANRDPSGQSLYPGQFTTGLCPTTDFEGRPVYLPGREPGAEETARRRQAYHAVYHAALCEQIERVKARHGVVVVYDCHSIRSVVPKLFDGRLPDLNIGTDGGRTCAASIEQAAADTAAASAFTHVVNGRFRGGWITRHYGVPADGVHAIQMEIAQCNYMDETAPWTYRPERAAQLRAVLGELLQRFERLALTGEL